MPVLMLTAHDDVAELVRALDAGADNFLTKPFSIAELLAREFDRFAFLIHTVRGVGFCLAGGRGEGLTRGNPTSPAFTGSWALGRD